MTLFTIKINCIFPKKFCKINNSGSTEKLKNNLKNKLPKLINFLACAVGVACVSFMLKDG